MARRDLSFVCQNCGAVYGRWQGKCDSCNEWTSIVEEASGVRPGGRPQPGPSSTVRGRIIELEALKGDRAGQHSIRINDQYRICFVWRGGDAHDVAIVDYHD